jgi:DNA-directed RNA polymerase subunit RPC12/RpoP
LKFLGRARRFLQDLASEPESKAQYFNVTCASGHRVRGERTEGYQALRCPACGAGVFVLPRSPLPEPVAPARPERGKSAAAAGDWVADGPVELTDPARVTVDVADIQADEAEIVWDDAVEAPPAGSPPRGEPASPRSPDQADDGPEPTPRKHSGGPRVQPSRERPRRPRPKAPGTKKDAEAAADHQEPRPAHHGERQARAGRPPERVATDRRQFLQAPAPAALETGRQSRKRRYHQMILVVVPLLVVLSVGWRYWRSKQLEYPIIIERAKSKGIPALEEGNFDKANQDLSAAKAAVDALGGAVDDADEIRTAAAEAALFVDQAPVSLEDMLEEAGRTADRDKWASTFSTLYKGRAIVFDTWVIAEAGKSGGTPCEILYKVLPPGAATSFDLTDTGGARHQRMAWIDLAGFQLFEVAPPKAGEHVTFGARLAAFEYDDAKDIWVVRLEPKSGVFIIHTKALQALGWRSLDDVEILREE